MGSASDYASIPQNVLLAVVTGVVYRFGSRQQRFDRVWQMLGAVAFATAAVSGVLTVTGLLPGVSAVAAGAVIASAVWLLAIGVRAARLPDPRRARAARIGRLIAATMLYGGALTLFGFGINVAAVVWAALVLGCLAWLAIPIWVLVMGRALMRPAAGGRISETAVSTTA